VIINMDQEWIQIGNYLISRSALDILVPLVSGLLGTIIGGTIAFLSVRASSNHKWNQERKDRLLMERREALASALEWFDPFRMAVMRARLLTESYMRGMINEDGLRSQWPSLIGHPGIKDPPAKLQAWLPPDSYDKSLEIMGQFEKYVSKIDRQGAKPEAWSEQFGRYSDFFDGLEKQLKRFEDEVIAEYKHTFIP
jgi:hypothetical protein